MATKRTCFVKDCARSHYAHGLCFLHYKRVYRDRPLGDADSQRSGKPSKKNGYRQIRAPSHPTAGSNGRAYEHRMVAFDAGLLVNLDDQVHHRNRDKLDNRLENLEVLSPTEHAQRHVQRPTHCPQGHPYDDQNTHVYADGSRRCRACHRQNERQRKARLMPE